MGTPVGTVKQLIKVLSKMDASKTLCFPLEVDGEWFGDCAIEKITEHDDCVKIRLVNND
jgi:hypothetical protein